MNPLTHFKNPTILPLLIALTLCFGLLPIPKAFGTDTDGALPFGNNADGVGVLVGLLPGGVWNSGFGYQALNQDTTGSLNTAMGLRALFNNTEGTANTANGMMALFSNTTGEKNVAIGAQALVFNIDGAFNTAVGTQALSSNTNGSFNTANGAGALFRNTEGSGNTANGYGALAANITGSNNAAFGAFSGSNITTANNVICIGAAGENVDNSCYIGHIFGGTVPGGATVIIDNSGHLGTVVSSARFKDEIKPMDKASEAILALKPVTFRYKKEIDPKNIPQFGLVAEDVAKVHPDLVARDTKGELYTVRYEAVNAMLLNEFLKEHRKVEELASTVANQQAIIAWQQKEFQSAIARQQKEMETVVAHLKEQDSKIQKVSDQIELSKPAPQTALNNQ
jgi:hypothetical protein